MRWRDVGTMPCSVARTLSVVGDRWTLLVLRDLFLGTRRFEDFQQHLGVSRHRLSDRLAKLVEHGILSRVRYQDRPERFEYRLTEKGRDLYPVVVSLTGWGDRWMVDADGPPVELIHRGCGHRIAPALTCPDCGEPIGARDMIARPGRALMRVMDAAQSRRPPLIAPAGKRVAKLHPTQVRRKRRRHDSTAER